MGSDWALIRLAVRRVTFQSTLPGWGATFQIVRTSECFTYFNPRSPDGERRFFPIICGIWAVFQSTLPGWGATVGGFIATNTVIISIHDPRMGSDGEVATPCCSISYFNPRSPDGERPKFGTFLRKYDEFQSTLPGWGATD